jgi:hypothetical protein
VPAPTLIHSSPGQQRLNAGLHAGQTLTAQWPARARNLTGIVRGSLEIPHPPDHSDR